MKLGIWWPTNGNFIRMGVATSFPYPALPSRFKSLLNATRNQRETRNQRKILSQRETRNQRLSLHEP